MAGWSRKKRLAVERAFYAFLDRCSINSKDASGPIYLGECLYDGQRRFVTEVFDALEADIHEIYCLKSRQLGLSTIARALSVFMLGIHHGLKGAIVFDTDSNKNQFRLEIETMIKDLPNTLKFPEIDKNNRIGLTLANQSQILFMSAGTRRTKSSGVLGRSVGLSLAHLSELCSYDNPEGLEAFKNSLSDVNPDRLYIYESTARGYNQWEEIFKNARADPTHCRCIFLGWWSKETQVIPRDHADFVMYGEAPPTIREIAKIRAVKEQYHHEITPMQLAWYRRKMDPSLAARGDKDDDDPLKIQENPWTEEEAFQQTGSTFFPPQELTDQSAKYASSRHKNYMFGRGTEFFDVRAYTTSVGRQIELKVWEEPDVDAAYVMGIDPAFGTNELNDRSAIQVFRCYADGLDQVAEYAYPLINTRQLAWVIAALLGWYGSGNNEVRYILELNGPGTAVFNELRSLKFQLDNAYRLKEYEERGLQDIFRNVRTYIYSRPDSLGAGYNFHFVTTTRQKVTILERMRDFVANGTARFRSMAVIDEMKSIRREGDSIGAPSGRKDDRVLAAALSIHAWEEKVRRTLIASRRTREAEQARKRQSITDQTALFNKNTLSSFFEQKQRVRTNELLLLNRNNWRAGARR